MPQYMNINNNNNNSQYAPQIVQISIEKYRNIPYEKQKK